MQEFIGHRGLSSSKLRRYTLSFWLAVCTQNPSQGKTTMSRSLLLSHFILLVMFAQLLQAAEQKIVYPTPPEAVRQDAVPRGQLIQSSYRDV